MSAPEPTSAHEALVAAVATALRAAGGLAGASVFDAPPVRAALPFVTIEEPVLADAGAKGLAAQDGRLTIAIEDGGERPERLRALLAAAIAAMAEATTGDGWRVLRMRLARARIGRAGAGRWRATAEFAVRLYREG